MILAEPKIRQATISDLSELTTLFVASLDTSLPGVVFSQHARYQNGVEEALGKRLFPEAPPADNTVSRSFVIEDTATKEIQAYAIVKLFGGPNNDAPELDMFFVKVEHQGTGLGGFMMDFLQKEWADTGLWVMVFKRNERGVTFYRKWGFEPVKEFDLEVFEDKEKVNVMRWESSTA